MGLRPRTTRTSLSTLAGLALAAVGLVVLPGSAHAAAITTGTFGAGRLVNDNGTATCTVTNASGNTSTPFTSNGATVTQAVSGSSTVTDTGDVGDVTTVASAIVGKVRATEAGGQLTTVLVDSTLTATITAAQGLGTDCDAEASTGMQFTYDTTLVSPRWVTFEADLPKGTIVQLILARTSPASPPFSEIVALIGNAKGHAKVDLLLPAGTYTTQGQIQHTFQAPQVAGDPTSVTVKPSIHVTYTPVGTATTKAVGDGTKYLKLKDVRKCGAGQLRGKFKPPAGIAASAKIKKATFKVNGAKVKTVKLPTKGDKVTLTGLPADQAIDVKVILKFFVKGSATLTRSYLSCD